ncbi:MAG: M20/M25/M40 family metallo-hydrolase [Candidatus Binatia bacterium]|jgi:acetylornithine deacetylase/succinyl-diaminopimelate desuccinylase-like protein
MSMRAVAHRPWSWAAAVAAALLLARAATAADINWADVEKEAADFLRAYIQIDTSNPPGNEIAAARFLAGRLRRADIGTEVFESEPGRGSVLARVKGSGGLRPVILLSHLDVVPAKPDGWQVPPFSGAVRDGYVYGRGAIDCKGPGTVEVMALLLLKRYGIKLKRDVIFLGTADEETGGQLGAGWMVAHHFDALQNAELLLNEGASVRVLADGSRVYEVAVSEKTPCWLQLTTTGPPGHGSAPAPETAVTRLIRALEHLRLYQPPLRVTPEVQAYYAALAAAQTGERRERYKDLRAALADEDFRRSFLQDPHDAALVHDTITPTVLQGSPKTNVIPSTASAELDCRLLPGEDPKAFVRTITDVIADPDVKVSVLLNFSASSSPIDAASYAAVRTLAERDGVPVVPSVLTGFTDSHYFREKGIASYGFIPFDLSEDEERREHGVNERVSTLNLRQGTQRLIELLQILDTDARYDGESRPEKK